MAGSEWTSQPDMVVFAADDVSADQLLQLDVQWRGDRAVLHVAGEVDTLTSPLLTQQLTELFDAAPSVVVLDLNAVNFLSSSGLAAMMEARTEAQRRDISLQIVCSTHAVLRPLTTTGLVAEFDTYPDLQTALG